MARVHMLTCLALLAFAPKGNAYSPGKPTRHDVFSPNGKYVLDVNPETKLHSVQCRQPGNRVVVFLPPNRVW